MFNKYKEIQTWKEMIPKTTSIHDSQQFKSNRINVLMNKYSPLKHKEKELSANKVFSKSKDRQLHRTFIENGNTSLIAANNNNKSMVQAQNNSMKEIKLIMNMNGNMNGNTNVNKKKHVENQLQKIHQIQKQNQSQPQKPICRHHDQNSQLIQQNRSNKMLIQQLKEQFQGFKNTVLQNLKAEHSYIQQTIAKVFNSINSHNALKVSQKTTINNNKTIAFKVEQLSQVIRLPQQTQMQQAQISKEEKFVHMSQQNVNFNLNNSQPSDNIIMKLPSMKEGDQEYISNPNTNSKLQHSKDKDKQYNIRDSVISSNFNMERQFISFQVGSYKKINPNQIKEPVQNNGNNNYNNIQYKNQNTTVLSQNMKKISSKLLNYSNSKREQNVFIPQVSPSLEAQTQKYSILRHNEYKSNIVQSNTESSQQYQINSGNRTGNSAIVASVKQQNQTCNKFLHALQKLKSQIRDIKQISNTSNQKKIKFTEQGQCQNQSSIPCKVNQFVP